jgi:predicted negative regulator of RcsB-dependent stress response
MTDQRGNPEPVITAEGIRLVLLGAVALGWAVWDEPKVMTIATAAAALTSIGASVWARARVTPLVRRWLGR